MAGSHPRVSIFIIYMMIIVITIRYAMTQSITIAISKFIFGWLIFLPICASMIFLAAENKETRRNIVWFGFGLIFCSGIITVMLKLYVRHYQQ